MVEGRTVARGTPLVKASPVSLATALAGGYRSRMATSSAPRERRPRYRTNLGLLGVAATAALLAGPSSAQRGGPLNGTWRGTLAVVAATKATPATFWHVGDRPEIEIAISGKSATVRVKAQTWQELKLADGFRVTQIDRTGLVSGRQVANGWAEHWNLTVTTKSSDQLLVFLS